MEATAMFRKTTRRELFVLPPTIALALGWLVGGRRPTRLHAGNASRSGKSVSATGTFSVQQTMDRDKKQVALEAAYWIDYRTANLFATVPQVSKSAFVKDVISQLAVRDLIVDFKLAPGTAPEFLMNTASLGAMGGGSSALFVIETKTRQVAVYYSFTKETGINARPEFELIQLSPYAQLAAATDDASPVETTSTSGAVTIQSTMEKTQVPLDAVYWVESSDRGARLFTAIPEMRKIGGKTQMMSDIAVRDLAADFKLRSGVTPRFLLNTASLGAMAMGTSGLLVIETTTKQIAIYRSSPKTTVRGTTPDVAILQIRNYHEPLPALPEN
jgi:hypothetical protein